MGKLTLEPFECLEYMKEYIASHILPKRSLKYTTKSPCMFSSSLFFNCLTPYFYVKCSSLYVLCMYIVTIFLCIFSSQVFLLILILSVIVSLFIFLITKLIYVKCSSLDIIDMSIVTNFDC